MGGWRRPVLRAEAGKVTQHLLNGSFSDRPGKGVARRGKRSRRAHTRIT